MKENSKIIVLEDSVPAHHSFWANEKIKEEEVPKIDWPAFSPDLNPIEHIWDLIKGRIITRSGAARVTTRMAMVIALQEEWNKIMAEEINNFITRQPEIIQCCLDAEDNNNYHGWMYLFT